LRIGEAAGCVGLAGHQSEAACASCPFADVRPRVSVQAFVVFESPEEAQRACQKDRETFGDKFGDRYVRVYPTLESDVPDMQLAFQQQHMMQQVRQDLAAGCLQWIKAECTAAAAWSCGWRVGLYCAMAIKCVEHCAATGAAGSLSTPADQQLLRPCAAGKGDTPFQVGGMAGFVQHACYPPASCV
jgi:hypothetical protein